MKFLVPNYNCLQNPWLGGYRPQIPVLSVLRPQLNLLNPPWTRFLGTPLIVAEAEWAPQPTWTGAKNLTATGIRSPDHLARSESLCRLSDPGPGHERRGYRRLATAVCGENSSAPVVSDRYYRTDSKLWELSRSISVRPVKWLASAPSVSRFESLCVNGNRRSYCLFCVLAQYVDEDNIPPWCVVTLWGSLALF